METLTSPLPHILGPLLLRCLRLLRHGGQPLVELLKGVNLLVPELAEVDDSAQVAAEPGGLGLGDILQMGGERDESWGLAVSGLETSCR